METAVTILAQLEQSGHKAYIAGGAVRDKLLGTPQNDIDIVTLAGPRQVLQVAQDNKWGIHEVGLAFGVVVVVVDGQSFEVASARREYYGQDSHRPEEVCFVEDIEQDLARRDFTINAMAMDISGELIDPFGGQEDLRRRIIRAVGDPELRFREDGLRPFRAVRFAAQLGFTIEQKTLEAIPGALPRVQGLSVERVRGELEKILLAPYPAVGLQLLLDTGLLGCTCLSNSGGGQERVGILPELLHLKGLEQNPRYHLFDAWQHTLKVVEKVPPELTLRWAALLHDTAKGLPGVRGVNKRGELTDYGHDRAGREIARRVLTRLKVPRAAADRAVWLVGHHMTLPEAEPGQVKKWLVKRAADFSSKEQLRQAAGQLLLLRRADIAGGKVNGDDKEIDALEMLLEEVLEKTPLYPADLALTGEKVARELGAGPQVKKFLNFLLEQVQKGRLPNEPDCLEELLRRKAENLNE